MRRGPAVRTARPHESPFELALAATVRTAAPHQLARRRHAAPPVPALLLEREDLRERVRRGRACRLVMLVVDASGSMGARDRMAATKGAVLSLLLDAYRRRDRVGLIAFRGAGAELLLPPTNSVELAERRLRSLPTGGRTPLAAGLELCARSIERAQRALDAAPLVVLVSDVRPNAASGGDPWRAAIAAAAQIAATGWEALVIDTEGGRGALGLGRVLAAAMGARHLPLDQLRAGQLEHAIRTVARWG
jgi:magnesium chelatase subunit D